MSGSVEQRKDPDSKSQKSERKEEEEEAKSGEVNKDQLKKCSQCGKKETTVHCVHCGMLVCRSCRGEHVRNVMGELKKSKDYLEIQYPRAVRERIAIIAKVQRDLEEKKKKALVSAREGFKELRKQVDAREEAVNRQINENYNYKKRELDNERAIFEGHLEENKQQNDKVSNNSCAMIHFPTGSIEDSQVAMLCQTRKLYADIIENLHKPDEREEPQRSKLSVKFDKSEEDTFKAVRNYGIVKGDKEEDNDDKKNNRSKRESNASEANDKDNRSERNEDNRSSKKSARDGRS